MDALFTGCAAAGIAAAGFLGHAAGSKTSTFFGPSLYRGDPSSPRIALTFDDGPCASTPKLLELLARHEVHATFFMCGKNVRRWPAIAREVVQAGHEIGNHTYSHPRLPLHLPGCIRDEVELAQKVIADIAGVTPRLFRAPFGVRWFGLQPVQRRLNLQDVLWTVIGDDWRLPGPQIAERVRRKGFVNGSIVCLHDGFQTEASPNIRPMLDAVATLIPEFRERGLGFARVSGGESG